MMVAAMHLSAVAVWRHKLSPSIIIKYSEQKRNIQRGFGSNNSPPRAPLPARATPFAFPFISGGIFVEVGHQPWRQVVSGVWRLRVCVEGAHDVATQT